MRLGGPEDYYEDRDVPHAAQGDIYDGIPFAHATVVTPEFEAAGARKRTSGIEPAEGTIVALMGPGILLHYTCGITAQPPGIQGYSHEFRLMAPVISLRDLKARFRMGNNELRKIRDGRTIQGFMYLPQTEVLVLDDPSEPEDEWTGHAAALIYRPALVSQAVLDRRPRLHQLTGPAIKILDAYVIHTFSPNDFRADDLAEPDLSNGWSDGS